MIRSRFAVAAAAAAAVILSAPFAQQLFAEVSVRWPARSRPLGVAATAVPAALVLLFALWHICERRILRYGLLVLGFGLGAGYILFTALTFAESFHFVEYGVLAVLFYRAWRPAGDWSNVILPLAAGTIAGSLDEWFQWFIPIRAGEARDVLLNSVAMAAGLLVAAALEPPARVRLGLDRPSRAAVARWTAATLVVFALFFYTVHVGYDVGDPEIGSFRSRYTAAELQRASRDRAERWRTDPPAVQRMLWREDHYLTEALWHVQQRNRAWNAGDVAAAWRENRILEKFYTPVLDTPTWADSRGHRWPAAQHDEAASKVGTTSRPYASDAYAYPLYPWALF
ncbi:MAG: VanZ family protein [Acidobacteria bacterium]|nr:VanZ family protein [Acidobacteriota bacterium]